MVFPFLSWLWETTLMASILVGLIILVKYMFKYQISARWHYLIWFLLILRLSMPIAFESSFSLFNVLNIIESKKITVNYFHKEKGPGQNFKNETLIMNTINGLEDYSTSVDRKLSYLNNVLFLVWFTGVIVFAAFIFLHNIRSRRILNGIRIVKDRTIINLYHRCKEELGLKGNPLLAETPAIQSPMIYGTTRPYILLPSGIIGSLKHGELRYIILHELAHYKRKDLHINWVLCILQIIHWFNPFIWYALHRMRLDREVACDASILASLKPDEYKSYGAAIITFLDKFSYQGHFASMTGIGGSKSHIRTRIWMIASFKKQSRAKLICSALLFVLIGFIVLTNAKGAPGLEIDQSVTKPDNKNVNYEDLTNYFHGYDGSFVLFDLEKGQYHIFNQAKSEERVSPCSTYKIISSLTGLETGVLGDENTLLKWNGTVYPYETWNQDQTLASAINHSVSWYFQEVDSRVGDKEIKRYLDKINYGNGDITGGIKEFWLQSSLKISPLEQVEILKNLYLYQLPYSSKNIDIIKKTIKLSEYDGTVLSGKTGSGIVNGKSINGWFVGYVEKGGNVYFFSTNIQARDNADGKNASRIALSILRDKNIY